MRTYLSFPSGPAWCAELGIGKLSQWKMLRVLATRLELGGASKRGYSGPRWVRWHSRLSEARGMPISAEPSPSPNMGAEAEPSSSPAPRATCPGNQGPKQKAPEAAFGPNSFSAAVHFQHTGIAPADSKPGQRKLPLVSGRGERSSRGRAPQKSPN